MIAAIEAVHEWTMVPDSNSNGQRSLTQTLIDEIPPLSLEILQQLLFKSDTIYVEEGFNVSGVLQDSSF